MCLISEQNVCVCVYFYAIVDKFAIKSGNSAIKLRKFAIKSGNSATKLRKFAINLKELVFDLYYFVGYVFIYDFLGVPYGRAVLGFAAASVLRKLRTG